MAQDVTYRFGSYVHETGEVVDFRWEESGRYTKRGWRDTSFTRATIQVQVLGCNESEIRTKVESLYDAYKYAGDDPTNPKGAFGMYYSDGSPTKWVMDPNHASSMRGPYLADISCPTSDGHEMVTSRVVTIVMESIYAAEEKQIIEYEEHIMHVGTTGPQFAVQNIANGNFVPRFVTLWPNSTETIVQEGHSVGFLGYYLDGMLPSILVPAAYEHLERRQERIGAPQRLGRWLTYYPAFWRYEFEVPNYIFAPPLLPAGA